MKSEVGEGRQRYSTCTQGDSDRVRENAAQRVADRFTVLKAESCEGAQGSDSGKDAVILLAQDRNTQEKAAEEEVSSTLVFPPRQ